LFFLFPSFSTLIIKNGYQFITIFYFFGDLFSSDKVHNGVNNDPLFSVCKFTPEDEKRLKELKESLGHKSISESELEDYDTTYNTDDCPEIEDNYDYDLEVDLLP
jgi:hypothetical protein